MGGEIRTGRVSSIDYASGTYEVTYTDRGKSVTRRLNAISNGEYKMPKVGQMVSVVHNSNGTAAAVAAGTVWNHTNKPVEGYKGLYRKEYGEEPGQAYERFDAGTGAYTQVTPTETRRKCGGTIRDECKGYILMVDGDADATVKGEITLSINGTTITVDGEGNISIECQKKIEIKAQEISLTGDTGNLTL
ncbi:MAG: DUF2345 domain-containing protein [Muribaculaceae bacterium]|nr:DUF2345 domain-containing protein [Muribaculaceae bacterium]MCM1439330.1 DUF2345 domain-containing protein [Roseburia sp.]